MREGLTDMQNSLEIQNLLHLLWRRQQDRETTHPWCGLIQEQPLKCQLSLDTSGFVLESAIWRSSKQSCGVS